jgi:hypothetical protein
LAANERESTRIKNLSPQICADERRSKAKAFTAKDAKERKGDQDQGKFETARRRSLSAVPDWDGLAPGIGQVWGW